MNIELGREYKDKISGFRGVCTGRCNYISGCDQALLSAPSKDGKLGEANWFDIQRLELVGKKVVTLDNSKTPGADMAAPIR
jgi:hypothetical protein